MDQKDEASSKLVQEAVVSTRCQTYVKKFYTKATLNEKVLKKAKLIYEGENPEEQFEALTEIIDLVKKYKTHQRKLFLLSSRVS